MQILLEIDTFNIFLCNSLGMLLLGPDIPGNIDYDKTITGDGNLSLS